MTLIATTENKNYKPIGGPQDYYWAQFRDRLSELGPEYSSLLAEPVTDPGKHNVDWYSHGSGNPIAFRDLSPDQQKALLTRLREMREKARDLSKKMEVAAPHDGGDSQFARAMLRALAVPDPEQQFIWSASGAPVLVAWGHKDVNDKRDDLRIILEMFPPRPKVEVDPSFPIGGGGTETVVKKISVQPEIISPAKKTRLPWASLLWLLFAMLIVGIYWRLLPACGLTTGNDQVFFVRWLSYACSPSREDPALAGIEAERDALDQQIQAELIKNARVEGDCAPPVKPARPIPVAKAPPPKPDDSSIDDRLEREKAKTGALQISLVWNGVEDLDLRVACPGSEIYFSKPEACGGKLDVDMNNGNPSPTPVENIFWATTPPPGRYAISVTMYQTNGAPPRIVPFTVQVKRGTDVQSFSGTMPISKAPQAVNAFTQ